jgi:hypothetical protein
MQKPLAVGQGKTVPGTVLSRASPGTTDGMGQGSMVVNIFGIKRLARRRGKLHYVFLCYLCIYIYMCVNVLYLSRTKY